MKKRGLLIGVCVISLFFLGACSMVKEVTKKKIPVSEIVKDGNVDVEKAKEVGYVSYAEKEKLGYFTVDSVSNKKVQKEALAEKDTIYKNLLPVIKENTGREDIEILGMRAIYPYPAVDISYKSKEAPYIYGSYLYGVEDGGPVAKNQYANKSGTIQESTIEGLYAQVYAEKIANMRKYILNKYPNYQGFTGEGRNSYELIDNVIKVTIYNKIGEDNHEKTDKEINRIYVLYQQNPKRSLEEWQNIFHNSSLNLMVYVDLVAKDEKKAPTKKDLKDIFEDIKTNQLFTEFGIKGVALYSNMIDTNSNGFLDMKNDAMDIN